MSVSITYPIVKYCSGSLQFYGLFVCYRSWQWRSVCWAHSICRLVRHAHHPVNHHRLPATVNRLCCFRAGITSAQLPRLYSGVRWFSDNERGENDDRGSAELKGFVFHFPNPLGWLKDKWYTYRIQSLVDPLFNLREFQIGAKQVWFYLCSVIHVCRPLYWATVVHGHPLESAVPVLILTLSLTLTLTLSV